MSFFSTLNYSSCNEDGLAELRALDVSPGDVVGCITGSGDRALHLLLGDPERVIAFDANPVQNHLLELKMSAIRQLDYQGYVRFLGLFPPAEDRLAIYRQLRLDLSEEAAAWFDRHPGMIRSGVLYAGRWECYFRLSAFNLRLLRGRKIRQLFAFDDLAAQRDFLHAEWNTWLWSTLLRVSFCRPAFRFLFGDPGFYANVDPYFSPARYIHGRMTQFLEHHLARSSFMLALVFQGRFFSEDHFPPYLQETHFITLRNRLDRVIIRQRTLSDMLESEEGRQCNKFSLSDVSSFLNQAEYGQLFRTLAALDRVRFCVRDFLTNRSRPESGDSPISYLTELQEELALQDLSFGYTFIIGEK